MQHNALEAFKSLNLFKEYLKSGRKADFKMKFKMFFHLIFVYTQHPAHPHLSVWFGTLSLLQLQLFLNVLNLKKSTKDTPHEICKINRTCIVTYMN